MKPIIRYMIRHPDGYLCYRAEESRGYLRKVFGPKAEVVQVEIRVVEPKKKAKVKRG